MAKRMSPADDATAAAMAKEGLSLRAIGRQLDGRDPKTIAAAVERHAERTDTLQIDWKAYRQWLQEGIAHGWDRLLQNSIEQP